MHASGSFSPMAQLLIDYWNDVKHNNNPIHNKSAQHSSHYNPDFSHWFDSEKPSPRTLERNMPYERPHAKFSTYLYEGTAFDHSHDSPKKSSECNANYSINSSFSNDIREAKNHVDMAAKLLKNY